MLIIVLEDSSRNKMGGGQVITLEVIRVLKKQSDILLVDTDEKSLFSKYAVDHYGVASIIVPMGNNILVWLFRCVVIIINNVAKKGVRSLDLLVYAATKRMLVVAFLLKIIYGYRFVYHSHMVHKNFLEKLFVHFLLFFSERVIACSNAVKKSLGIRKAELIYNPITCEKSAFSRKRRGGPLRVSYIGSLIPIKSVETLLRANSYISREDIEMHIYGTGSLESILMTKFQDQNIVYHGFVEDKNSIFADIDILVLPTVIREACPLVIIEAAYWGIPVITTNIGGQKELFELIGFQVGSLVMVRNVRDMAEAILSCREALASGAEVVDQKRVEALFDRATFERKIESVFEKFNR